MVRKRIQQVRASRFARDSGVLQAGSLMLALLGLAGVLALSHILGAERQAEFYLASAVFGALWFALNLGVAAVATSRVAQASKAGELGEVRDWMTFAVEATLLMGILCAVITWFLVPDLLHWWSGSRSDHTEDVAFLAALLALEPLVGLPRLVATVGLQGTRRAASLTRLENSSELVRVLLVVVGALWQGGALGAVLGQLAAAVAGVFFAFYYYGRERRGRGDLPTMTSVFGRLGRVRMAGRWGLGLRMGLVRNIDAYSVQVMPALVLDRYGDTEWVAYLRIAQRIVGVLRLFVTGVGRTGLAALSEAASHGDRRRLGWVYRRTTALGGLCVFLMSLVLVPILPWFLSHFWPYDYVQPVWTYVLILIPGMMVMGFSVVNDVFYLITGRLKVGIWISIANFLVQIPLLFLLAARYPEKGVAIALSLIYASSAAHVIYALGWLRTHDQNLPEEFSEPVQTEQPEPPAIR
ncbi:MAG: MATE family efflux transporter [Planctomycetota bacterium]